MGDKIAHIITKAMATWTFIAIILVSCVSEIYGNAHGWFHFDPTMLVLNTILSLWAAVQGSIIMINQNQQDKRNDLLIAQIIELENKLLSIEQNQIVNEELMITQLTLIEEHFSKVG